PLVLDGVLRLPFLLLGAVAVAGGDQQPRRSLDAGRVETAEQTEGVGGALLQVHAEVEAAVPVAPGTAHPVAPGGAVGTDARRGVDRLDVDLLGADDDDAVALALQRRDDFLLLAVKDLDRAVALH